MSFAGIVYTDDVCTGSSDFFGLNHYTTRLIKHAEGLEPGSEAAICDAIENTDPAWDRCAAAGLALVSTINSLTTALCTSTCICTCAL